MKEIIELIKGSRDAIKERLRLPIVTYYIGILILIYWKAIFLVLFSTKAMEVRIHNVEIIYETWEAKHHIGAMALALLIAVSFSVIFPISMFVIDQLTNTTNNKRKTMANLSLELDYAHNLIESKYRFDKSKIESGNKEVEDYNNSIDELKKSYEERISAIEKNNITLINNLRKQISELKKDTDLEEDIFRSLEFTNLFKEFRADPNLKDILTTISEMVRDETIYYSGDKELHRRLIEKKIAKLQKDNDGRSLMSLTDYGKRFVSYYLDKESY